VEHIKAKAEQKESDELTARLQKLALERQKESKGECHQIGSSFTLEFGQNL
jgi:hypothetical protein